MKFTFKTYPSILLACTALVLATGCGGSQQAKDKEFFTSGNREADQRADQRMAQQEQLTGGTNNGGKTETKSNAVISTDKKALYDRLGGEKGIKLITEDFVKRALNDPRVNWSRLGVKRGGLNPLHRGDSMQWDSNAGNVKLMTLHIEQFLGLATGGPAQYTGKEMKSAHAGMRITNPEYDAAMGDLKATLDNLQIANQEQKELLSVIESTREQIVEER